MKQRYRKTLLSEYEVMAGLDEYPFAADYREEIGSFIIDYIAENKLRDSAEKAKQYLMEGKA